MLKTSWGRTWARPFYFCGDWDTPYFAETVALLCVSAPPIENFWIHPWLVCDKLKHLIKSIIWKPGPYSICAIWLSLSEKVYFRSQILECASIVGYWNISGIPVLPKKVIFTFFRTCWRHPEANNTGTPKWVSIVVQYPCTSIWDLKYTFSSLSIRVWMVNIVVIHFHTKIILMA